MCAHMRAAAGSSAHSLSICAPELFGALLDNQNNKISFRSLQPKLRTWQRSKAIQWQQWRREKAAVQLHLEGA